LKELRRRIPLERGLKNLGKENLVKEKASPLASRTSPPRGDGGKKKEIRKKI